MLEITSYRNGKILNHRCGKETSRLLEILLEGIADPEMLVMVNVEAVFRRDRYFSRPLSLTEKLAYDYDLPAREIIRFAGEKAFTPPTNVHWAMFPPKLFHVLKERGLKTLTSGGFMSNRIIVNRKEASFDGVCDIGFFYEQNVARHMLAERCYYDPDYGIFLSGTFFCCNIDTQEEIVEKITRENAEARKCEMMEVVSHERYSFTYYSKYLPDSFERIEAVCRTLTELGYRPVYFNEGIFGNTAWEKKRMDEIRQKVA